MFEKIQQSAEFIKSKNDYQPYIGIILGTGLGGLVNEIEIEFSIEYTDIPNFPVSTVESHKGRLIFGKLSGKKVVAMQGRFHYYEGYSMQEVVFPVRVMKQLGIKYLVVSNASGALNPGIHSGDIVIINDHINLQLGNPLIGKNIDVLGPRFPDMSEPYDQSLIATANKIARENKIHFQNGVYVAVSGPNLETKAEYKYLRIIGADIVGMSTVPEIIAARHAGIPCFAISVVTDEGWHENLKSVSLDVIIANAKHNEPKMTLIIKELIKGIE